MFQMLDLPLKYWEKPRRDYTLFREVSDAVKNVQQPTPTLTVLTCSFRSSEFHE